MMLDTIQIECTFQKMEPNLLWSFTATVIKLYVSKMTDRVFSLLNFYLGCVNLHHKPKSTYTNSDKPIYSIN